MAGLRIAIVDYHLRPGGVTRVIENAVAALKPHNLKVALLTGEPPPETVSGAEGIRVVEGLGYDRATSNLSGKETAGRLMAAARELLGAAPDLWHIHNHSLGKNRALPAAVAGMAREGERLLLQIHDFAEDGRPGNYGFLLQDLAQGDPARLGEILYPQGENVHYAPLNQRDHSFLSAAGVPASRLHYLPNAVARPGADSSINAAQASGDERIFLYVTRAIRRKNLGEFMLWAALADTDDRFELSMAPRNPVARRIYDDWVTFAESHNLPVSFEVGRRTGLSLAEMTARAHALVTTSIAEGFGLAFLEPWLMGRSLVGRDLPEITSGIAAAGVDLRGLYSRLLVPVTWIGEGALRASLRQRLDKTMAAYGRQLTPELTARAWQALVDDGRVDFGRLDEPLQSAVIRHLLASREDRRLLQPFTLEPNIDMRERTQANREVVLREFSLEKYGCKLASIYNAVAQSGGKAGEGISAQALLDMFLAPERFSMLRTS